MSKDKTNQNGITLIALIITIIVMLILIGVTVATALNGGLFSTAKQAAKGTSEAKDKELALSGEEVKIDGLVYASMDDYTNNNPKLPSNAKKLTDEEAKAEGAVTANWDLSKVTAIEIAEGENGATKNTIPLPKGFQVSLVEGENTVSGGLVITDGENEFVWIPYTGTYKEDNLRPLTGTDSTSKCVYDSQEQLDYYYGEGYFNYSKDFNYVEDKTNIETSINKYKGFYVGRYETTYDSTNAEGVPQGIGVKKDKNVLTENNILQAGENTGEGKSGQAYYYRWYGLYKAQKDMYANSQAVFSTMITSKEWNAIMTFTGYGSTKRATDTYTTKPDKSGSAYKTDSSKYDISKNIYDLAGNVYEWTLKYDSTVSRVFRGGVYYYRDASASFSSYSNPNGNSSGSRF